MRYLFLILFILIPFLNSAARGQSGRDTLSATIDTVKADTLTTKTDTTGSANGIDSVVTYSSSDSIIYQLSTRTMSLYSKANVKHQQMELKAERIDVNWNTSVMMNS